MAIHYRRGTDSDSRAVFDVQHFALVDLARRSGEQDLLGVEDEAFIAEAYERRRTLFEYLAQTADNFWIAEAESHIVGYARAILQDGVRQLTDFFVLPEWQGQGIGRELLTRTMQTSSVRHQVVIASTDQRALSRYLKQGLYPLCPIFVLTGTPQRSEMATDLRFVPAQATSATLAQLNAVDTTILGFQRPQNHAWLLREKQGYLYYRGDQIVGYGYIKVRGGPFALLDNHDFPAVLAHAEGELAAAHCENLVLEVPGINHTVLDYLLGRGYELDSFLELLLCDTPFGQFDRYILMGPSFFL